MKVVLDTNVWMDNPGLASTYDYVVVPLVVLEELDQHKNDSGSTGLNARESIRYIESTQLMIDDQNVLHPDLYDNHKNWSETSDNLIISSALRHHAHLVTNDTAMIAKAKILGIEVIRTGEQPKKNTSNIYTGVKEIFLTDSTDDQERLAEFYQHRKESVFGIDLLQNEYLLIWQDGKVIERLRKDNFNLTKLKFKEVNNRELGKVSPRNERQKLLFDLLQNDNITIKVARGGFGTGKDFSMISNSLNMVLNNKFEKLIWVRNNVSVKDVPEIGYLPSDMISKLLPWALPLADHIGGIDGLKRMLDLQKIEIEHLGFIRGRDFKNSIVYVSEAENNTKSHIQLLISRIGEGSQLWINGDTKQIDSNVFMRNNGLDALNQLAGNKLFGLVTLDKTERSETARLADLLD